MHLFLCCRVPPGAEVAEGMVRVAVATALERTSLSPCVVCDGVTESLEAWLRRRGVRVVHFTSPLAAAVERTFAGVYSPECARGSFLRIHVPDIAAEMGVADEHALYADTDVMFMRDPVGGLSELKPRLFAATPELQGPVLEATWAHVHRRRRVPSVNDGVMFLNLPRMRESAGAFIRWAGRRMRPSWCLEQAAYNRYYGPPRLFGGAPWDELPPRYNWKPCWGLGGGDIVHFHWTKPQMAEAYARGEAPEPVLRIATGDFFEAARQWREVAERTLAEC